jgi:hypothetical protein
MMQNGQVFPYMHANANHLLAFEKKVVVGGVGGGGITINFPSYILKLQCLSVWAVPGKFF